MTDCTKCLYADCIREYSDMILVYCGALGDIFINDEITVTCDEFEPLDDDEEGCST